MTSIWWKRLFQGTSRAGKRRKGRASEVRPTYHRPELEVLEVRIAPSVNATFMRSSGLLAVVSSGSSADSIKVTISNGNVLVNGADPVGGPAAVDKVKNLTITGNSSNNTIDLSQLTTGALPHLQKASINAGGGT